MMIEIDAWWIMIAILVAFQIWSAWKQNQLDWTIREHGLYALWEIIAEMDENEIKPYLEKAWKLLGTTTTTAVAGGSPWIPVVQQMITQGQQVQLEKARSETLTKLVESGVDLDQEVKIE